jgi:hypothetical protein
MAPEEHNEHNNMVDEDLSTEQLRQILKDAEQRLKSAQLRQGDHVQITSLSTLQKRYVNSKPFTDIIRH